MVERRLKKRKIQDRANLRTGLSIIPSLFTIGNIFCGCYSIIAATKGNFDHAAIAIGIGSVLDGLDGRVARMTNTASDFGLELDSLADVVTFGVAPSILAFLWGMSAFEGSAIDNVVIKHVTQFGWFATFAFVMCGTLRLARFNVMSKKPTETTGKRFFVGLPIPAAANTIAAIVHFVKHPIQAPGSALLWYFLVTLTAFLMISTIRYYSGKEIDWNRRPIRTLVAAGALIWGIFYYSEEVLLTLAVLYVTSGPVFKIYQFVRRFTGSPVPPSEPAHGNIRH